MKPLPSFWWQAAWQGLCPQCWKGKIFKYPAYFLSRFTQMNSHCPHCKVCYEKEIGFFYGAMYLSYGIAVFSIISSFLIINLVLNNPDLWVYLTIILSIAISIVPYNFRFSRILMLYGFGGFTYQKK